MSDDLKIDGYDFDDEDEDREFDPSVWNIGLEGRRWTVKEWHALDRYLPEKMELIDGKPFWVERERLGMLAFMLETVGLKEVVKLAPRELWEEALRLADADAPPAE